MSARRTRVIVATDYAQLLTDCWLWLGTGLVSGGLHEKKLLNDLLDSYNVLERPVGNESEPLQLSFGLTLMQIIDVVSAQLFSSASPVRPDFPSGLRRSTFGGSSRVPLQIFFYFCYSYVLYFYVWKNALIFWTFFTNVFCIFILYGIFSFWKDIQWWSISVYSVHSFNIIYYLINVNFYVKINIGLKFQEDFNNRSLSLKYYFDVSILYITMLLI